jgi:Ribonuclease G/E
MGNVIAERRNAPRYPLVLAAEVVELPRGVKLNARTSDLSRTGCYIDTLNPVPQGSQVRVRITHRQDIFEAVASVVYVSAGHGMGVCFTQITAQQQATLDKWLNESGEEY